MKNLTFITRDNGKLFPIKVVVNSFKLYPDRMLVTCITNEKGEVDIKSYPEVTCLIVKSLGE